MRAAFIYSGFLRQLTTDDTGDEFGGMGIGEEAGWVSLDLGQSEARGRASVDTGVVVDTRAEGSSQAADGSAHHAGVVADGERVGECKTWWACCSLGSLVDVCRC